MGLTINIYENQNPIGEMVRARLWPVRRMLKVADIPRQGTSFWVDDMSSIGGFHSHVPKNGWFIDVYSGLFHFNCDCEADKYILGLF